MRPIALSVALSLTAAACGLETDDTSVPGEDGEIAYARVKTPETTLEETPPALTNSTTAVFSFSSSGRATFFCRIDSAVWSSCVSPTSYGGLSEGSHSFSVYAVDKAGRADPTPASYTWTIDLTPPETAITSNPANPTSSTSATFSFASDEAGTFLCRLDAWTATPCVSPTTYDSLSEGMHTFSVSAVDAAGNVDPTPATYTWTIDLSPPVVTIENKPPSRTESTTAFFSFTASESASRFVCGLDGIGAVCGSGTSGSVSYSNLLPTSHTFAVYAVDAAGNRSAAASYTWEITIY